MERKIMIPPFACFNFSAFFYAVVAAREGQRRFGKNELCNILLTGLASWEGGFNENQGANYYNAVSKIPSKYVLPILGQPYIEHKGKKKIAVEYPPVSEEELLERLKRVISLPTVAAKRLYVTLSLTQNDAPVFPLAPDEQEVLAELHHTFACLDDAKDSISAEHAALRYLAAGFRIAIKNSNQSYTAHFDVKEELEPFSRTIDAEANRAQSCPKQAEPVSHNLNSLWRAGQLHWESEQIAAPIVFAAEDDIEKPFPAFVCAKTTGNFPCLLADVMKKTPRLFLTGDGGAGKTTALSEIVQAAYQDGKHPRVGESIPFYLDLSTAPDVAGPLYCGGRSTFVLRSLYRFLQNESTLPQQTEGGSLAPAFAADELVIRARLELLLGKNNHAPLLLLLDGVNEISRRIPAGEEMLPVAAMVQREIETLAETYPNLRIVMAGRTDDGIVSEDTLPRYHLCALDDDLIFSYLVAHLSDERVAAVKRNPAILKLLRLPMFLKMYVHLSDTGEADTQGELLYIFFGEKKTADGSVYTTRAHNRQLEKNLKQSAPGAQTGRLTAEMAEFILDFVLPEIAWEMGEQVRVHSEEIDDAFARVLAEDGAVRSRYGAEAFTQYQDPYNAEKHTDYTARCLEGFGGNRRNLADKVIAYCVSSLGILQREGRAYRFAHQVFREYFAAMKVINTFRIAAEIQETARGLWGEKKAEKEQRAFACLQSVLGNVSLDRAVCRMIGEILGEHKNAPALRGSEWYLPQLPRESLRSLCCRMLDICRGRTDARDTVAQLLMIIRDGRGGDLSGLDLSRLDLRHCRLNGVRLAHPGLAACFDGAQVARDTLFPTGHGSGVNSIAYHPDPTAHTLITASVDGTAKLWDTHTGDCVGTLRGHTRSVTSAAFHPRDPRYALTASLDGTVKIWDCESLSCIQTLTVCAEGIRCAAYRPDGGMIAAASKDGVITLLAKFADETYTPVERLAVDAGTIRQVCFNYRGDQLLSVNDCGCLRIWHQTKDGWFFAETDTKKLNVQGNIAGAVFHPSGERILVSVQALLGGFIELDADSLKPISDLHLYTEESKESYSVYRPDGQKIVSAGDVLSVRDVEGGDENLGLPLSERIVCLICPPAVSPDGRYVALDNDASVEIRDLASGMVHTVLEGYFWGVRSAAYHPAGQQFVIAGEDGAAGIWSAAAPGEDDLLPYRCTSLLLQDAAVEHAEFHPDPDANRLLTVNRRGTGFLWDIAAESRCAELPDHDLQHAAFGKNGAEILLSSGGRIGFALFDSASGELRRSTCFTSYAQEMQIPNVSKTVPRYLTISEERKALYLWDMSVSFPRRRQYAQNDDRFAAATYVRNGNVILAGQYDGTLTLYDADLKGALCTVDAEDSISCIAVSEDGTRAVVGGVEQISLWDIRDGCLMPSSVPPYREKINWSTNAIAFSPDGRYILAGVGTRCLILDVNTFEKRQIIPYVAGLFVCGIDLSRAITADLTDQDRALLHLYGSEMD